MQLKDLLLSTLSLAAVVRAEMGGMSSELGSLLGSSGSSMSSNSGSSTSGSSSSGSSSSKSAQSQVAVHVVQVGPNGTLAFSPDQLQVNAGDMVQFQFHAKNHSVVQSTFNAPCKPMSESMPGMTGFKSGFMPVAATSTEVPVFTMQVNDTKPVWIYCSQTSHCQKGMVMAINVASGSNKTLAAFKSLAMQSSSSSSGGGGTSGSSSSGTSSSGAGSTTPGASSNTSPSPSASSSAVETTNAAPRPLVNAAALLGLFIAAFAVLGL